MGLKEILNGEDLRPEVKKLLEKDEKRPYVIATLQVAEAYDKAQTPALKETLKQLGIKYAEQAGLNGKKIFAELEKEKRLQKMGVTDLATYLTGRAQEHNCEPNCNHPDHLKEKSLSTEKYDQNDLDETMRKEGYFRRQDSE